MSHAELCRSLNELSRGKSIDAFDFLARLSSFTSLAEGEEQQQVARELLVRVLEHEATFVRYAPILQALLRSVGLFPYLDATTVGVAAQIATEAHRPMAMPEEIVFTTKQAEVYRELMAGKNVVLSAPTSFGKSLIIDAIVATGTHRNIVVIVPTLALVDETRRRLTRFRSQYKIITHLSQFPADRNIFVHTQERVVENPHIAAIDFFVIDEFYKLQIESSADGDERAVLLNHAFYRLVKQAKQFYMLGPNITNLPEGFGENYRCTFIRTEFSTVASETHLVPDGGDKAYRLQRLVPKLAGPTLVFCGSVNSARKLGKAVADVQTNFRPGPKLEGAIEWLSVNYSPAWGLVRSLRAGVGVHHGKLPRSIAQMLVRLFNRGHLDHLVCTSTLIEGVNTVARNVVVADNTINKKKYDFFTFNNIRGRSGRMWRYYVGHVYLFNDPPQEELAFVDVPVFTQNDDAPDSLLVQLEANDLSVTSTERLRKVWEQRSLSLDTIKQNVGVDPWGQVELAREIDKRVNHFAPLLSWTGTPTYDQMLVVFDLAWRHFGVKGIAGVLSAKQLTFKVNQYRSLPSFSRQLRRTLQGRDASDADEALEDFLEFTRHWLGFKAPRLMSAVNRIQREVLARHSKRPGEYSFFCGQMESLFMSPVVVALEEYGVPLQLAEKIVPALNNPKTLDEALCKLAERHTAEIGVLSAFERTLVKPLCRDGLSEVKSV